MKGESTEVARHQASFEANTIHDIYCSPDVPDRLNTCAGDSPSHLQDIVGRIKAGPWFRAGLLNTRRPSQYIIVLHSVQHGAAVRKDVAERLVHRERHNGEEL